MDNDHRIFPSGGPPQLSVRRPRDSREQNSYLEARGAYALDPGEAAEGSEGLLDYWRILARHKFAIAGATFAGLILGFLVGIPLKPVFRASTTLEVLNPNEDFLNHEADAGRNAGRGLRQSFGGGDAVRRCCKARNCSIARICQA